MANDRDFRVKNGLYVAADANISGNTVIAQKLTANGNVNFTSSPNVALGTVGNVVITGGSNNQFLQTNGSGGLAWASPSITSLANGNSNLSIPTANGNVNISAVGNTTLVVTGTGVNVAGTLNTGSGVITGNGSGLSAIAGANVTGAVSSATTATNASALLQNTSTATTVYPTFTTSSANGNSQAVFNIGISANLGNSSITATTFVGALSGAASSATTAGTVTTNTQPNITSVGTLTDLSVIGNAIVGGNLAINGNLTYLNVETLAIEDPIINLQTGENGAAPTANSGKDVGTALNYFDTAARVAFMGWDVSNVEFGLASQASITNEVVTFTTYGNLRVGNIIGNGQALTAINGSNVTGTVASATTAGTVTTNTQPNITSVGTLTSLAVSGNGNIGMLTIINASPSLPAATGSNPVMTGGLGSPNIGVLYIGDGTGWNFKFKSRVSSTDTDRVTFFDNGNVTLNTGVITGNGSGLSAIAGGNVTGTVANATFATSATTAGTVTTAAQPNITSTGTLSSLAVSGNAFLATSSGNVGIGTSSPGGKLSVVSSSSNGSTLSTWANHSVFGPNAGSATGAALGLGYNTTNDQAEIVSVSPTVGWKNLALFSGGMTFNSVFGSEAMRIEAATGNVGIGTSAPGYKLTVAGANGTSTVSLLESGVRSWGIRAGGVATNTFDIADFTANASRLMIDSGGNVGIGTSSPSGYGKLAVIGGIIGVSQDGGTITSIRANGNISGIGAYSASGASLTFSTAASGSGEVERARIDSNGNFGIGLTPATKLDVQAVTTTSNSFGFRVAAGTNSSDYCARFNNAVGSATLFNIGGDGGITSSDLADAVGYKGLPQNSQSSAYTLALSDMGKHISITTGGVVIPANGTVAFPIGSAITIFNNSSSNQTISITTDTLRLAGTATTGSRTLAQYGVATCLKVTSTVWVISGAGLT
jgi:hypothetical protein